MTHENETALGMDKDTNIVLGVSAIPIIKNDILTVAGQMDAAVYDGVLSECEKKLSAKIDEVFNEFNSSNSTDKESLFEQLNTLFEGQSDMQAIITQLRNAIISLETGGEEGSVLSEETIKNVLNAALTTESFWSDDTIGAPSVLGQKIIGLVGEFGEVKASSLKGDTIEGLTLQSHLKDEDDKPLWQINKDGDGHLAGGNISWNDDGTIQIGSETKGLNFNSNGELTFGSDVKLSWENVDSPSNLATTDDIPDPISDEYISNITTTTITKDYVESLNIRAVDIKGDTITGKTIQSSDNSWKIGKDGDGHLAGGNISWSDDGTIQIGSETKGLNFNSNGELTFGSDVKLSWENVDGPMEEYKLTANVPYLRRCNDNPTANNGDGRIDYNNDKANDPVLGAISGSANMFEVTVKKYNSETGLYDLAIPSEVNLYTQLTYMDGNVEGKTVKINGPTTTDSGVYGQVNRETSTWCHLTNIRVFLYKDDINRCYVDIPVIGLNEEWNCDSGLTEGDVASLITTQLDKYEIKSEQLTGKTITGAVIKSGTNIPNTLTPTWQINDDDTGWLASQKVVWSKDTFNIHNSIKINSDNTIDIGPIYIDSVGNITDNSIQYYDLTSEPDWPSSSGEITYDFLVGRELYCYNAAGYTKSHISTSTYNLNFYLRTQWGVNKFIKIYFGKLENQPYNVRLHFIDWMSENGSTPINIIGAKRVGNGDLIYPTTVQVISMNLETEKTYLFKCEEYDGNQIIRYITNY